MRAFTRGLAVAALVTAAAFLVWRYALNSDTRDVVHLELPAGALQPQAVVDDAGTLHVVWFHGDPAGGDLLYAQSTDFRTISDPIRVNSEPDSAVAIGTIRGAQIALGGDGRIHVAWNGAQGDPVPMLYSRSDASRTRFEAQRNLMTRTIGLDGGGGLAADGAGNVWVAWHGHAPSDPEDEASRRVWIAHSTDEGATFAPEEPIGGSATGTCACCAMGLHATERGELVGLYRASRDTVHRDMTLVSGSHVADSLEARTIDPWEVPACPMSSVALAGNAERSVGAWETEGQVRLARLDGLASRAIVDAPGEGDNRKHPRVAIAANGEMLVTWTESTAWAKGGDLVWQLYDADFRPIDSATRVEGLPAWTFAAVAPRPDGGFAIVY